MMMMIWQNWKKILSFRNQGLWILNSRKAIEKSAGWYGATYKLDVFVLQVEYYEKLNRHCVS